jgi:uncharacterized protein (DUF427 family)
VLTVRPRVAELLFQVYGRPLHPELFDVCRTQRIQRGRYEATVDITTAGHVVTWQCEGVTLTEVAASALHPLPQKRRLMSYHLKGDRQDMIECRGGASYRMFFQLEPVEPDVFWTFQRELSLEREEHGMLYRFDSSGRMALGAISYVNVETRNRSLTVQAFHTFPDDYAVVRSKSVFQVP